MPLLGLHDSLWYGPGGVCEHYETRRFRRLMRAHGHSRYCGLSMRFYLVQIPSRNIKHGVEALIKYVYGPTYSAARITDAVKVANAYAR